MPRSWMWSKWVQISPRHATLCSCKYLLLWCLKPVKVNPLRSCAHDSEAPFLSRVRIRGPYLYNRCRPASLLQFLLWDYQYQRPNLPFKLICHFCVMEWEGMSDDRNTSGVQCKCWIANKLSIHSMLRKDGNCLRLPNHFKCTEPLS